jgi:hypothetical protein
MELDRTFGPKYGSGQTLSVTATSQEVTFGKNNWALTLTNLGADVCYVRTGNGTLTATAADYPVLPLSQVSLSKNYDDDKFAAVCGAGDSTSLHIIQGEGI